MYPRQLFQSIIVPALAALGSQFASPAAAVLLLATTAQETLCGHYLVQIGGPALGIFQMERATWRDVLNRAGSSLPAAPHRADRMVYDLRYAVQIARLKYYLDPQALPAADDIGGLWDYYKRVWNTKLGAATEVQFRARWAQYVAPALVATS